MWTVVSLTVASNTSLNRSRRTRFGTTHENLRTSHAMQRQRYKDSMPKTPRNQEPAYAAPYNEVVAVGYEYIPYHSWRTTYDRGYDMFDMYYKIPTRQTTCHDAWMNKFKAWKKTILLLAKVHRFTPHPPSPIHLRRPTRPPTPSPQRGAAH